MRIGYTPTFLRQMRKLPDDVREDALQAIDAFADPNEHVRLKVHKLKGPLAGRHAFSVNYRFRIVFRYEKEEAILLAIGDHDVYR
jgi:plasmid maintenance system killer protein